MVKFTPAPRGALCELQLYDKFRLLKGKRNGNLKLSFVSKGFIVINVAYYLIFKM